MTLAISNGHQTMSLPITVDLMTLAAQLEARGGKRNLTQALKSAWRAQSCVADLRQAQDICAVLDRLRSGTIPVDPVALLHVQSALMISSILLYARATATGGSVSERGSIRLKHMTTQQRDDHNALIRIRNGALGHVEPAAQIAGDFWHVDYLFAKQVAEGLWGVASASTSIGLNYDAVAMLKRQLPVATEAIRAKCHQRLNYVQNALREASLNDAMMLRHEVDPIDWFGSLDAARMMLAGKPGEESSSWLPLI